MDFPFVAVIGQEQLKMALLLNAVDPKIGGVLIRGDKGSGKSTLARALAELLPLGAPFIEVPAGATEDRVKGSIDLAKMVSKGEVMSRGGLMAEANEGVLYVDEVNLLSDHIVDLLLDTAASGINRVERDGISAVFQAEFILIGSMNPEEGELRPQLLDRFGLSVSVSGIERSHERGLALLRRLEFDADPEGFCRRFMDEQEDLKERLVKLRERPLRNELGLTADISEEFLELTTQLCLSYGAQGLRADLAIVRASAAHAALMGRRAVDRVDIEAVAPLALAHRARRNPLDTTDGDSRKNISDILDQLQDNDRSVDSTTTGDDEIEGMTCSEEDSAEHNQKPNGRGSGREKGSKTGNNLTFGQTNASLIKGVTMVRGSDVFSERVGGGVKGPTPVGYRHNVVDDIDRRGVSIDVVGTLTGAALRRATLREETQTEFVTLEDFKFSDTISRQGRTILLGLDLSGSVGASSRIELASKVVESLLIDAYQTRDLLGVIVIASGAARVLQKPTGSVELIRAKLSGLETGGSTPLGPGIDLLCDQVKIYQNKGENPICVLVTDGRATGTPSAFDEAISAAVRFRSASVPAYVFDLEDAAVPLGLSRKIALAMGAELLSRADLLEAMSNSGLRDVLLSL